MEAGTKKLKPIVLGFLVKTREWLRHNTEFIGKKGKGSWKIDPERKQSI